MEEVSYIIAKCLIKNDSGIGDLKSNRRSGYNVTFLYLINRKVESDKISKPTSNLYFWILNLKGEDSVQS